MSQQLPKEAIRRPRLFPFVPSDLQTAIVVAAKTWNCRPSEILGINGTLRGLMEDLRLAAWVVEIEAQKMEELNASIQDSSGASSGSPFGQRSQSIDLLKNPEIQRRIKIREDMLKEKTGQNS